MKHRTKTAPKPGSLSVTPLVGVTEGRLRAESPLRLRIWSKPQSVHTHTSPERDELSELLPPLRMFQTLFQFSS